jgi:N2-acetyl-L-2,4-diaminobutanoate deacetylase
MTLSKTMSSQWQIKELATSSRHSLVLTTLDGLGKIPFTVVIGAARTPVALVIAGAHGDEYEGPAAIQNLMLKLDPDQVKGSIIFVPVANPAAFAAASRRHPVDNGDLNRSFPGSPQGGPTEQLAHLLLQEFALISDCVLSLHGWSKEASLMPYAEYAEGDTPARNASREVALVLGFRYLHPYHWPVGVLGDAVLAYGIPIVETEVGGAGTITPQGQHFYREVILRFLAHFQIVEFESGFMQAPVIVDHSDLFASHAGLLQTSVEPGDAVVAGQPVGTISGLDGVLLETLRAPCSGIVAILRRLASVQPNDRLLQIFWDRETA